MIKIPPKVKVLEALGAIGDKRIKVEGNKAIVKSSTGERTYRVYYYPEKNAAWSTDNGTRFRKYVGYPIIALLMKKGKLSFNEKYAKALSGIPWKKINDKYKDYSKTEEIAYKHAKEKGVDVGELKKFVEKVIDEIKNLKLKFPFEK